ncbi:MAG: GSCFA domain-containing protein [Bacteroidetes bacterium]|uniref:GSCFA domain-containing protein n=1 Tax=Candidatus Enterocola intestinipullorum TaxID=2840783 RepID=A0A9D9HCW1_9BACT|nr:GSCFA domain-containing protein [Candidatus Enterocola intestinipullorum]
MDFRTEIKTKNADFRISHKDRILLLGSCFSQNMNTRLRLHAFKALNPFGALYNPLSVLASVKLLLQDGPYDESNLFYQNEMWHSYDFHSDYSGIDKASCLEKINGCLEQGRDFLRQCRVLFISLGTSFCYRLKDGKKVVANCHKSPAACFERFFLPTEACIQCLKDIAGLVPDTKIVFTVSPIRHLRDGLHANQISKSNLLLAIDAVCNEIPDCSYFPSYEIVMDDLRDYRYYAGDMVHLADQAIDYIWEKFSDTYFSDETKALNKEIAALRQMQAHRIINPSSQASKKLEAKIEGMRETLIHKNKELDL